MRRYFVDNLRWIAVIMLIPYHTWMMFNNWGELYYVHGADNAAASFMVSTMWPWYMPLLFLLAGMSARYALEKRTQKEFIKERFKRLLIPSIAAILLYVPALTYFSERFYNQYDGSYLGQYVLFFTKPTDLTGYAGGFTPSHTWFMLYLFLISLISLPMISIYHQRGKQKQTGKINLPILLLLAFIPMVMQVILDIEGKSLGEYLAFFLLGYMVTSEQKVQEVLAKNRFLLAGLSLILLAALRLNGGNVYILNEVLYGLYAMTGVYCLLGMGCQYLDFSNKITDFFAKSSFGVYIFHQIWAVMAGYYILQLPIPVFWQAGLIMTAAAVLTFINYIIFCQFKGCRVLFGISRWTNAALLIKQ